MSDGPRLMVSIVAGRLYTDQIRAAEAVRVEQEDRERRVLKAIEVRSTLDRLLQTWGKPIDPNDNTSPLALPDIPIQVQGPGREGVMDAVLRIRQEHNILMRGPGITIRALRPETPFDSTDSGQVIADLYGFPDPQYEAEQVLHRRPEGFSLDSGNLLDWPDISNLEADLPTIEAMLAPPEV